jgi:NAD(P)-dependent dehydrogenase (short-subunit alcohol dehydrogenase family)
MIQNPFDLAGRTALVTGCGSESGIGFASARLLARLGARVAITSTTDRIETRAGELRAEGRRSRRTWPTSPTARRRSRSPKRPEPSTSS